MVMLCMRYSLPNSAIEVRDHRHEKPYSNLMCLIFVGMCVNMHGIGIYFWFQGTLSDDSPNSNEVDNNELENHEADSNAFTLSNEEGFMTDKSGDDPDSSSDDDDGEDVSEFV